MNKMDVGVQVGAPAGYALITEERLKKLEQLESCLYCCGKSAKFVAAALMGSIVLAAFGSMAAAEGSMMVKGLKEGGREITAEQGAVFSAVAYGAVEGTNLALIMITRAFQKTFGPGTKFSDNLKKNPFLVEVGYRVGLLFIGAVVGRFAIEMKMGQSLSFQNTYNLMGGALLLLAALRPAGELFKLGNPLKVVEEIKPDPRVEELGNA